jgi:hypothetical protein
MELTTTLKNSLLAAFAERLAGMARAQLEYLQM